MPKTKNPPNHPTLFAIESPPAPPVSSASIRVIGPRQELSISAEASGWLSAIQASKSSAAAAPPGLLAHFMADGHTAGMERFEHFRLADRCPAWVNDPNTPTRMIVRRATNRFQVYQLLEGQFLSVGYALCLDDRLAFLRGYDIEVVAEFGEDTDAEPLTYPTIPYGTDLT